jgi:hypothetical protein
MNVGDDKTRRLALLVARCVCSLVISHASKPENVNGCRGRLFCTRLTFDVSLLASSIRHPFKSVCAVTHAVSGDDCNQLGAVCHHKGRD